VAAPEGSPTMVMVIGGPITRADVPALCERVRRLVEASGDAEPVTCDVGAVPAADIATVDALARLQLAARRLGASIRLRHAGSDLQALLALTGLADAVGLPPALPLGGGRQPEEREQPFGIEEEVEPGDPTARDLEDLERERLVAPIRSARAILPERGRAVRRGRQHP
jgi:ABC-type transporter Mla MlaB component